MKKRISFFSTLLVAGVLLLVACNSNYTYKKKGYFRIDFPEKKYQVFEQPGYPYSFEYPVYAKVVKDSTFFNDKAEDYWINIEIPQFEGRIYVSYKAIGTRNNFDSLVNDAFKMAYRKNTEIATGIETTPITTPNGVEGMYFSLEGNTATANQFFLTDSVKNFFRGALYFDAAPNEDSLRIVNDFLKKDMEHLINTLKWR
jgi:gliding motility-associated lipoprotein GldD